MREKNLRIPEEHLYAIDEICERTGMTFSTFCREAIVEKLTSDQRAAAFEDRLAATLTAFRKDQQALLAMVDTFVLAFLTCVPEPANLQAMRQAAQARYQKFLEAVAGRFSNNQHNQKQQTNNNGNVKTGSVQNDEAMV